jgi:D-alanyl-lipoteichoic acid acyltransferase DltB (MBOAT superfamily)
MLFNSFEFLFAFLPIALIGFQLLASLSRRAAILWLALISIAFYGLWNTRIVFLLLASASFNYVAAVLIERWRHKSKLQSAVLFTAVSVNLAALCYFKYLFPTLEFLHDSHILSGTFQNVILPLGISFFTFTQIGYLIDLKQGEAELEPVWNYVFFVTFFPHLIAGPILHHREIMPQLSRPGRFSLNSDDISAGITLFAIGLFKKVVLADKISGFVGPAFAHSSSITFLGAWGGALSYALQLYFDFSGYSDMAIGLARMFSIRFPLNFNSPYKAKSIIDFWQRWHMTLTRYLTLYLYNPIALNATRRGAQRGQKGRGTKKITVRSFASRVAAPTLITMFLAGVWHGAGLQFLVFGLLHGVYICTNHAWRTFGGGVRRWSLPLTKEVPTVCAAFSVLLVFIPVVAAEIFFRANSVNDAANILLAMAGAHGIAVPQETLRAASRVFGAALMHSGFIRSGHWTGLQLKEMIEVFTLLTIVWFAPNSQEIVGYRPEETAEVAKATPSPLPLPWFQWRPNVAWATVVAVIFVIGLMNLLNPSEFLYFQF